MERIVVVAPLKEGGRDTARLLIEDGPPFDPAETRLTGHTVSLTDTEAIFVFEGPNVRQIVETLIGDAGVLRAAAAWRECLAGRPRIAVEVYAWRRDEGADVEASGGSS